MNRPASFQRVWETLRFSFYDQKNEELPNFHIITPQISICKARKLFLVWLSIQCHRATKKVADAKAGALPGISFLFP